MAYDFSKILGRIIEKFGKQYAFAAKMGWSERTCSMKINSKIEWKQSEIIQACNLLDICNKDIPDYFFKLKVQNE